MDHAANYGALILTLLGSKFKFPAANDIAVSDQLINHAVTLAAAVVFAHVLSSLFNLSEYVRNLVESVLKHTIVIAMSLLLAAFVMLSKEKSNRNLLDMEVSLMANNIVLVFFPLAGAVPIRCYGSELLIEKLVKIILFATAKYIRNNRIESLTFAFASVTGVILLMTKGKVPAIFPLLVVVITKSTFMAWMAVFKFFSPPAPPHPHSVKVL